MVILNLHKNSEYFKEKNVVSPENKDCIRETSIRELADGSDLHIGY